MICNGAASVPTVSIDVSIDGPPGIAAVPPIIPAIKASSALAASVGVLFAAVAAKDCSRTPSVKALIAPPVAILLPAAVNVGANFAPVLANFAPVLAKFVPVLAKFVPTILAVLLKPAPNFLPALIIPLGMTFAPVSAKFVPTILAVLLKFVPNFLPTLVTTSGTAATNFGPTFGMTFALVLPAPAKPFLIKSVVNPRLPRTRLSRPPRAAAGTIVCRLASRCAKSICS